MTKTNKSSQSSIVKGNPSTAGNTRVFIDGSTHSYAALRTAAIGFGIYQPGWRWSLHARPQTDKDSENHIGYVKRPNQTGSDRANGLNLQWMT